MTIDRRGFLGAAGLAALSCARPASDATPAPRGRPGPGRLRQSVCRWPFADIPLDRFCADAAGLGLEAIDLLYPDEWERAHAHGLIVSTGFASRRPRFIQDGFNDRSLHDMLVEELTTAIPLAAANAVPNLIVMSGNRRAGEADGIAACAEGLRRIVPLAERHGITLCMEMLNSTVDHPGYDADSTRYGLEVVERVGSPAFRLLYDIYHMQVMEGNVIATVRAHHDAIAHLHTAGVPGRHELDDTQELNYRAIANAIADLEFAGFIAHEFVPTRDPLTSLRQAIGVCDV